MELGPKQEEWIRDLESGKYRRGELFLKHKVKGKWKYCCLGVLCAINKIPEGIKDDIVYFDDDRKWLPTRLVGVLGLYSNAGKLKEYFGTIWSLTDMNDRGWSFKKIAKYIRENVNNVFK